MIRRSHTPIDRPSSARSLPNRPLSTLYSYDLKGAFHDSEQYISPPQSTSSNTSSASDRAPTPEPVLDTPFNVPRVRRPHAPLPTAPPHENRYSSLNHHPRNFGGRRPSSQLPQPPHRVASCAPALDMSMPPAPPRHRVLPPTPSQSLPTTPRVGHDSNPAFEPHIIAPPKRVEKVRRPQCIVCRDLLRTNQRIVRTDYGTIHAGCFVCSVCRESLELAQFYFQDGEAFCHLDYHQIYSPKCGHCGSPVEGEGIVALGKHWHKGHFFCHECSTPFREVDEYYINGNEVRCGSCQGKTETIKCWRCDSDCAQAIEALGRIWCSPCFCCEICSVPFNTNEFVLREDGTLSCHRCEIMRLKQESWRR
ncbi:hypothetical protein TRVA0_029S01112 [Trichomonascus vanleenenianus]|uniref:uncharacterized protein n=1 Tax=Trichomonascus vanleenenianus TaxID=2268995 RepID=UPI003EC9E33B